MTNCESTSLTVIQKGAGGCDQLFAQTFCETVIPEPDFPEVLLLSTYGALRKIKMMWRLRRCREGNEFNYLEQLHEVRFKNRIHLSIMKEAGE